MISEKLREKIRADSYYGPLLDKTNDMDRLVAAGFFDDGLEPDRVDELRGDTQILTTPLHKIIANLRGRPIDKTYSVLVTTGAFSPIHMGHISMMEQTRQVLTKKGEIVVGGFIAPGHDSYVSVKSNGEAAMDAARRVETARMSIDGSSWLMVDPWPTQYVETEINFTTILERTDNYLRRHLPGYTIQIWYVYGQDNQGFAEAFAAKPGAVCVGRSDMGDACNAENVVVADQTEYAHASSTKVRQGDNDLMHENVKTIWQNQGDGSGIYGLRNDLLWATSSWNMEQPAVFCAEFLDGLQDALSRALHADMPIKVLSLDDQQKYLDQLVATSPILNLDVCLNGGERLDVSRLFTIADLQAASVGLINRPHSANLNDQIAQLTNAKYVYFDDDIATGGTFRRVRSLLKRRGVGVTGSASALQAYGVLDQDFYDINDMRDFLLGARSGGLVVGLPHGEVARAPYMAPYVSLTTRAKIPVERTRQLSIDLWTLNANLLKKYAPNVHVRDADPGSRDFLNYMGFDDSMRLYEVAQEHLRLFKTITI